MPQLDKVTFLTQFFWLVLFYFGFYLLLVTHFLPKMGTLLKLRQAKMNTLQDASKNHEKTDLHNHTNALLSSATKITKNSFVHTVQNTSTWLTQTLSTTNQKQFKQFNQKYLSSLHQTLSLQNTIQLLHAKAIVSPRAHLSAGLLPNSGTAKEAFFTKAILKNLQKTSAQLLHTSASQTKKTNTFNAPRSASPNAPLKQTSTKTKR